MPLIQVMTTWIVLHEYYDTYGYCILEDIQLLSNDRVMQIWILT